LAVHGHALPGGSQASPCPASRGPPEGVLRRLEAELEELWSFMGKKANRHWVWIALEAATHQVIAFHVGDRSGQSAHAWWKKFPAVSQARALFSTDHSAAYTGVIPSAQHRAISRLARKTHHVERFNCTLRQRVSRRVRGTLSVSKQ